MAKGKKATKKKNNDLQNTTQKLRCSGRWAVPDPLMYGFNCFDNVRTE